MSRPIMLLKKYLEVKQVLNHDGFENAYSII